MRRYYEYIRENDLTLPFPDQSEEEPHRLGRVDLQEGTALQVVRDTDAGIVVRGARFLRPWGRSPTRSASIRRAWAAIPKATARSR